MTAESSRLDLEVGGGSSMSFEKSFDGRGRLVVVADTPPGIQFPPQWTLVVEPSLFLEGKSSAERRVIELGEGDFELEEHAGRQTARVVLEDLSYGSYAVSAEAVDMNTTRNEVVLFEVKGRPDLPGRRLAEIQVRLSPAGFLDGSVVSEVDGAPIEGCPVRLENLRTRDELGTVSSASGVFVFPSLKDGRYRLEVGREGNVLHEAELSYSGPERTLEPVRIQPMASAVFRIRDEIGGLVPNVLIEGYSDSGAGISARTDLYGEVRVPFLPAGAYRIKLNHPTGRHGKTDFVLEGGEVDRLVEGVVRQ